MKLGTVASLVFFIFIKMPSVRIMADGIYSSGYLNIGLAVLRILSESVVVWMA